MTGKKYKNPWKTLSGTDIYENPWIKLEEHQVINPGGGKGIYGKVHFKNIAIGILPLDSKNNAWLVGQHRYTIGKWSWEIPEGGGAMGVKPLQSAKRELKEETGLIANKWKQILKIHLSNSVTDEVGFIFLASDIKEGVRQLEATEADMKVWKLPFKKVLDMVLKGEITDGLTIAGVLRVARMMKI